MWQLCFFLLYIYLNPFKGQTSGVPFPHSHVSPAQRFLHSCSNLKYQIKKFELLPAEFTVESGELTPTLKFKRKMIMSNYKDVFDKIYN